MTNTALANTTTGSTTTHTALGRTALGRTVAHLAYAVIPFSRRRFARRLGIERPRVGLLPWLGSLPLAALVLFLTWSGWCYPLRSDALPAIGHPFTADPLFATAWGGPTLVGAWFIHAMAALGMQVVCLAMIRVLNHRRAPETV